MKSQKIIFKFETQNLILIFYLKKMYAQKQFLLYYVITKLFINSELIHQ